MESPSHSANSQAIPNISSKSIEEKIDPSIDLSQSSREVIPPEVPQPLEDSPIANASQDREYSCKYCYKKFSNKQALGGHQNAHKVERAMEKNSRGDHENHFGYIGGTSSYAGLTSTPFLGSYNTPHEFMNRSIINWLYPSQQPVQHGIRIGYHARPGLSMGGEPYASRPLPRFNSVYSGWAAPIPKVPQFTGLPSYMQNRALNNQFSSTGASSSSARPFPEGLSPFAGSRLRHETNHLGNSSNQMNNPANQQLEDSDLDLSLKL